MNLAHNNLIRVLKSLSTLGDKFFVSADVCGIIKVWQSALKPVNLLEFQLEGAISYNSMIEIEDMLPNTPAYADQAVIACALKNQKVHLILLKIPPTGTLGA